MELNMDKFTELSKSEFKENYAEAGRQLNVAPAQIFRIINNQGKAGALFLGRLCTYCNKHKLEFKDYIILVEPNKNRKEA